MMSMQSREQQLLSILHYQFTGLDVSTLTGRRGVVLLYGLKSDCTCSDVHESKFSCGDTGDTGDDFYATENDLWRD